MRARTRSPSAPAWNSWRHAVATSERLIWRNVAVVRRGGTGPAADEIKRLIKTLRKYYQTPRTQAFDLGDRREYGFRADPDAEDSTNRSDHPGRVRLKRMLSHAYNALGYANSRRGDFQEAIRHYMTALAYAHTEDDLTRPSRPGHNSADRTPEMGLSTHRAKVINNTSRAYQEMPMPAHQAQLLNNTARSHSEIGNPATEIRLNCHRIDLPVVFQSVARGPESRARSRGARRRGQCRGGCQNPRGHRGVRPGTVPNPDSNRLRHGI